MSLEKDAAFLAGFIVGQYDIKGEEKPPEFIREIIQRCLSETPFVFKPSTSSTGNIEPTAAKDDYATILHQAKENARCPSAHSISRTSAIDDEADDNAEKMQATVDKAMVRARRKITPELIEDIQKKRAAGMTMNAIGEAHDLSAATLYNWLKKSGISLKSTNSSPGAA